MIEIFTDGSSIKNGTEGGYGGVVLQDGVIIETYQERFTNVTNNAMELCAIAWAFKKYGVRSDSPDEWPIIYSDSQYSVNTFTKWMFDWEENGWYKSDGRMPKNLEIIKDFFYYWKDGYRAHIQWVKGHADNQYNILADKLATERRLSEEE